MSHSIVKNDELTVVTYWGSLNVTDVQEVAKDALGREVLVYKNRIEDTRDVTSVDLGFKELHEFAKTIRAVKLSRAVKTAILTKGTLQYGIARMFQMLTDDSPLKIEIFTDEAMARKWLLSDD